MSEALIDLFESSLVPMAVVSSPNGCIEPNDGFAFLLGHTREELSGILLRDLLVSPEDAGVFGIPGLDDEVPSEPCPLKARLVHKEGRFVEARLVVVPLPPRQETSRFALLALGSRTPEGSLDAFSAADLESSSLASARGTSVKDFLAEAREELGEAFDTSNFYVAVFDEGTKTYSFPYSVDAYDTITDFTQKDLSRGLTDYVRRKGESLLADEKTLEGLIEQGEVEQVGARSKVWMGVPLVVSDKCIGVVATQSYDDPRAFGDSDLELMERTAERLAVVLERKLWAESIRESEEKYKTLTENIPVGLFRTTGDPSGRMVSANPALARMFGYPMSELLQMSVSDLYADPSARKGFLEAMRSSGEISRYEVEFERADGTSFTGALSARATLNDAGEVEYMDGILEDFTELKEAQDAMRKSEEKYRQLVEQSQGIVVIQDGSMTFVNQAFADICGYDVEELLAMSPQQVRELVVPEDREMVWGRLQARLDGEEVPSSYEFRGRRKNGEIRWLQIFSRPVQHEGAPAVQGVFIDVTDRKRAEDALKSSEREKETILSSLVEHVVHEDRDMRIIWANQAACESVGMDRDQLIGRYCYQIWADRDDPCPDCPVLKAMRTNRPQNTEKTTPDGRAWYIRGYPVEDENGEVVGGIEVTLEITEQKKAEEAYETERTHLKSLFESAPEAIAMADSQSRMIRANPEFLRLFGYTEEEVEGKAIDDLIVPPDRVEEARGLTKSAASGELVQLETVRMTKEGELINVSLLGAPVFLGGEQVGVYAIYRDVTDSKRAERALRESEERYRALTEEALAGVYILQGSRFLFVNQEMTRITGYSREELLDMDDVGHLVHPDDLPMTTERGTARQRGEEVSPRYEMRLIRKDGKVRTLMVATRQVPYEGKAVILGNLFDITDKVRAERERREIEAKLWQAQKLESLGVLAGGIAHDFNNLLMAILGNVDLAMDSVPDDSEAVANIREIGTAAQSAAALCSQMLAYSGKGTIDKGMVDLNQLVIEMGSLLEVSIYKDVRLKFDLSDRCRQLQADSSQMRQVVMNLIINASEAIGEQVGLIEISTGCRHCSEEFLRGTLLGKGLEPGRYVYLEVSDSGRGMDDETIKRMFDPFFTTKFAGRGLGLAAVLGIVRKHGGTINVSSEPGSGTTFTVFFPPGEEGATAEPEAVEIDKSWSGEGKTILLVDDEELVLSVGKRILQRAGFEVEAAPDGLEALEIFRKRSKDISGVILDLTMPRMAGNETYVEMKQIDPDVPIILSTGHSDEDVYQRFNHREDIAGILHKPYTVPQLLDLLKKVLEGRS